MRKVCLILIGLVLCIDGVNAAERGQNTTARQSANKNEVVSTTRTAKQRTISSRNNSTSVPNVRGATNKSVVGRSATKQPITVRTATTPTRISRAATSNIKTRTFGNNYNSCRDAYFTCMDQFCAIQNDSYRRCVCSSKLQDIQNQERALSQTATGLQDFEDLNVEMVSKTAAEVKAMTSATAGENAMKKDSSINSTALKNITDVLNNSKKQSLSTAGKLDIAGDIKQIWSTTDLIVGTDLANLTGESLFNAVHKQCAELVKDSCATSDLKMVASAYGMYIENDCAVLQNNLDKQMTVANSSIRTTRHKLQDARLENYDAHNSLTINECVAKVREDITANTACGENFIHCLDFSGKYLNITTGEAIYSPEFYQIENQLSLSGDILKNNKNSSFISMLNKKRVFAEQDLDLCRDNADEVWNDFLRQAIVEIYQSQQKRVETVKNECLQVVNECYLKQSDALKKFANTASSITFVQTMELSEEMCTEKLNTCSNLYGGGPEGLDILISTMTGITNASIEQSCPALLATFVQSVCAVPKGDTTHSYPYGCRKYAPGESYYARTALCNETLVNPFSRSDIIITETDVSGYEDYLSVCKNYTKIYTSCNVGFYLYNDYGDASNCTPDPYCYVNSNATECHACPSNLFCPGDKEKPVSINDDLYKACGQYYVGSLYQQMVIYALQNCSRSSNTSNVLSESLLAEIDKISQNIKSLLVPMLAKECTDLNGVWVDSAWIDENNNGLHDKTGNELLDDFYVSTGANKLWGYCKKPN